MDDLAKLKAVAGERHARDEANNPDLASSKVPSGSAAQKTDSALGHLTAALATDQDMEPAEPQRVNRTVAGESIPLDAEPGLAESIASRSQTATNPASAAHFAEAGNKLADAYAQDKEWLAKHPEQDQSSRS